MLGRITSDHRVDDEGMPAGGRTTGKGITIDWQDGPLGRDGDRIEPNGAFVETVILAAKDRIEWYQTVNEGQFECGENGEAIALLDEALQQLNDRTKRREAAGIEGTHDGN